MKKQTTIARESRSSTCPQDEIVPKLPLLSELVRTHQFPGIVRIRGKQDCRSLSFDQSNLLRGKSWKTLSFLQQHTGA